MSACAPSQPTHSGLPLGATGPANAAPGTCWNKTETPAIIETIQKKVLVSPAHVSPDGRIHNPAVYKTENHPKIVQARQENWYQIICNADMTPEFIATLQRALTARGFYTADVTGKLDRGTRKAVARFQASQNLPGSVLTAAAARQLGLITVQLS